MSATLPSEEVTLLKLVNMTECPSFLYYKINIFVFHADKNLAAFQLSG